MNLLPCPFCGGTNVLVDYDDFEDFCVCCDDCIASGPVVALGPIKREDNALRETAKAKAVELWNRRATLHVEFTKSETAYTTINDQVFIPLTPKVQRLA